MELFIIYLWLKLDTIIGVLALLSIFTVLVSGFCLIGYAECSSYQKEERETWIKRCKKWVLFAIAPALIAVSIPNQKETAILVGSHYAIEASKSAEGQKVMTLIRKKANEFLDEQISKKP